MAGIEFAWSDQRELVVDIRDDVIRVTGHPSLSEGEVALACAELGEHGPAVLRAWRQAVGLDD